jgi:hypothetical protein
MTGEWWLSSEQLCYEEITYTVFTIAQVRRSRRHLGATQGPGCAGSAAAAERLPC